MSKKYSAGVDIGGSHITSAIIDLDTRKILPDTVVTTEVDNSAPGEIIIKRWSDCISASMALKPAGDFLGIGFAMPGPFDYVNGICLIKGVPKYEKLYGVDIGEAVRRVAGLPDTLPVRFINDASAFAVGESWAGKTVNYSRSMAITLGTGFGSAFVENRVPVVTGDSVPGMGCVYHLPYGSGIADDYFSTRWFTRRYAELTGKEAAGVKDVAEAARTGNSVRELFVEFGSGLGIFLAPWLLRFRAESLVIGGNISRAFNLFGPSFHKALEENGAPVAVVVSELMEEAALYGSACLLEEEYYNSVKDTLRYM